MTGQHAPDLKINIITPYVHIFLPIIDTLIFISTLKHSVMELIRVMTSCDGTSD